MVVSLLIITLLHYVSESADGSCMAVNSCTDATIFADYTYCFGDQSCSNAMIYPDGIDRRLAYGGGAYSLLNATIDSNNSAGLMFVTFAGYHAGFGTLIICQANDMCRITCNGNSCDYLKPPQCLGGNNCVFVYDYRPPQNETFHIPLLYDSLSVTATNDINCNQPTSMSYDIVKEHINGGDLIVNITDVSSICCRGYESCRGISKIEYDGPVICSGEASCYVIGMIANSGDLFCGGYYACGGATISNKNIRNIYCWGSESCYRATIIAAGNVYCGGFSSCEESIIKSNGDGSDLAVYFLGSNSMDDTTVRCEENDFCRIIVGIDCNSCTVRPIICDGECVLECPSIYNCPVIVTMRPTLQPTVSPSFQPTTNPTNPTVQPTAQPTTPTTVDESKVETKKHFIAFIMMIWIVFFYY